MDEHDLRLDGNAAAGALQELFGFEVTAARGRCDGCGAVEPIGALVPCTCTRPGMVFRCAAHCERRDDPPGRGARWVPRSISGASAALEITG